jgi:hypothetical protein
MGKLSQLHADMTAAGVSTPSDRLAYARVVNREAQIKQACHDVFTLGKVVDELREDYQNSAGRDILCDEREFIQATADKLTELLAKIGTKQMEAAE